MSEYVPTTEQIREEAIYGYSDMYFSAERMSGSPERFDRWLAAEIRRAKESAYTLGYQIGWNDHCDATRRKGSPTSEDYRAYESNPYKEATNDHP